LYNRKEYPEDEVWLGWFCADPTIRGQGIGRRTLEWSINKAREMGYKKLKLYTSTDPAEAAAQGLYESVGLKIYKREPNKGFENEEILYRELGL
jgi:GNAT superfamily N-acetyltransferase